MRDRALGSTLRLKFTTTDSNGAPIAPSSAFVASDFRIYKDGSASEKTSTNGITVTSPFDSVVGRHLIEIDTSNSTGDAGFWSSGSAYFVELNTAKTVNGQSVSGLEIGSFSLELQTADVRKFGGTALTQSGGRPEVNTTHLAGTSQTARDIGASVLLSSGTGAGQLSLSSGTVTVGTNNDKSGYSITQSFPANFASLGINASGHVSRVTLVDTTTTNSDMRGTDNAALASNWTATRAGYLDSVVLAQNANQRTVQITGSNHVASDVHAFQNDVIDSAAIAASAVTELQSGLALQATVLLVKSKTDLIVGLF